MFNDRALGNTTSPKGQLREQFVSSLHSMKYREKSTLPLNFNKGHRTRELLCQKAKSLYRSVHCRFLLKRILIARVIKSVFYSQIVTTKNDKWYHEFHSVFTLILSKSKFELGGFCFIRPSVSNYMVFSEQCV